MQNRFSRFTCDKCGYKTDQKTPFNNHVHHRKHSCNKEYDDRVLELALEKIKTFETQGEDYQITYNEDGYTLFIKRNCFYNFEDYFIQYQKPNAYVKLFAEWKKDNHGNLKKDKLILSK